MAFWALMVYATATETGDPVDQVSLEQLRYRLGDTAHDQDTALAVRRCTIWLHATLHHTGHQISLPSGPQRPLGLNAARVEWALGHYRRCVDADDERRDDPVVHAWQSLTAYALRFHWT